MPMILLEMFSVGSITDADPGDYFLSRTGGNESFLVGTIGDEVVGVKLEGSGAFSITRIDQLGERRGLIVRQPKFTVEFETAQPISDDHPTGSLFFQDGVASIRGSSDDGSIHQVVLGPSNFDPVEWGVSFGQWRLNTHDLMAELYRTS